jgi:ribonucleoside-diphosphate reductase alpha chain
MTHLPEAHQPATSEGSNEQTGLEQMTMEIDHLRSELARANDRARRRLPDTRQSITHHFSVSGHEGYITVGLYEDGTPGELFVTMAKEGGTLRGLTDAIGVLTSLALQYGVRVECLAEKFCHSRFEPSGHTTNRDIPVASSITDYLFTWLGLEFSPGFREAYKARQAETALLEADDPPVA